MKPVTLVSLMASGAAVASAQITQDPATGKVTCALPNANYCAGESLATNIIIRCTDGVGQPGNCNDNLAGVPPVGVKTFAPCYQSSDVAGDAACSWDNVVYPDNGSSFTIPGASVTSISTPPVEPTSTPCTTTTPVEVSTSCSTTPTEAVTPTSPTVIPPPYSTPCNNATTLSTGSVPSGPSWSASASPTMFTGAASPQQYVSSLAALIPLVGFLGLY